MSNVEWDCPFCEAAIKQRWYVGAMNDCVFIIDRKPSPAPLDYPNHGALVDDGLVISMRSGSHESLEIAESIVKAHNDSFGRLRISEELFAAARRQERDAVLRHIERRAKEWEAADDQAPDGDAFLADKAFAARQLMRELSVLESAQQKG